MPGDLLFRLTSKLSTKPKC